MTRFLKNLGRFLDKLEKRQAIGDANLSVCIGRQKALSKKIRKK